MVEGCSQSARGAIHPVRKESHPLNVKTGKGFAILLLVAASGITLIAETRHARASAVESQVSTDKIVQYIRQRFGVPETVKLTAGPLHNSSFPGFFETVVTSDDGKQKRPSNVFVTKDGHYFVTGSLFALASDPKAEFEHRARDAFKVPPATELTVAPFTKSPFPEFLKSTLTASDGKNKPQTADVYMTRDSKIGILGNVLPFQEDVERLIVTRNQPSAGPANAPVTIVEYADLQCPTCARFHEFLEKELLPKYGDKVRIVFKEFPLPMHDWSHTAAIANECAYQINPSAFVAYRSLIFKNQSSITVTSVRDLMLQYGEEAGVDRLRLAACIDSKASLPRIEAGHREGEKLGVSSTPTSFINGRIVVGATPEQVYKMIDEALAQKTAGRKQQTEGGKQKAANTPH